MRIIIPTHSLSHSIRDHLLDPYHPPPRRPRSSSTSTRAVYDVCTNNLFFIPLVTTNRPPCTINNTLTVSGKRELDPNLDLEYSSSTHKATQLLNNNKKTKQKTKKASKKKNHRKQLEIQQTAKLKERKGKERAREWKQETKQYQLRQ